MAAFNPESIPGIAATTFVGAPAAIPYSMYFDDLDFYDAADEWAEEQVGFSGEEAPLDVDEILDSDPDALEKAHYQDAVGTTGTMTPYGPALSDDVVVAIIDEYPGLRAYTGIDDWDELDEEADNAEYEYGPAIDEVVLAIEEEGDATGDQDSFWDKVMDVGNSLAVVATNAYDSFREGMGPTSVYAAADDPTADWFDDTLEYGTDEEGDDDGLWESIKSMADKAFDNAITGTLGNIAGFFKDGAMDALEAQYQEERAITGVVADIGGNTLNAIWDTVVGSLEREGEAQEATAEAYLKPHEDIWDAIVDEFGKYGADTLLGSVGYVDLLGRVPDVPGFLPFPSMDQYGVEAAVNVREDMLAQRINKDMREVIDTVLYDSPTAREVVAAINRAGVPPSSALDWVNNPETETKLAAVGLNPAEVKKELAAASGVPITASPVDPAAPDGDPTADWFDDTLEYGEITTPATPVTPTEPARKTYPPEIMKDLIDQGYSQKVVAWLYYNDHLGTDMGDRILEMSLENPTWNPSKLNLEYAKLVNKRAQTGATKDPTKDPTKKVTTAEVMAEVEELDPSKWEWPSYLEQFYRIFNDIPGSQRYEAQQGKAAMFNEAEALFYLGTDWSQRDWVLSGMEGVGQEVSMKLDKKKREDEELKFGDWLKKSYLASPRDTRYGQGFYQNVRDLRDRMLRVEYDPDMTESALYKQLEREVSAPEAQNIIMNRILFMEPTSNRRLARVVGMYNVHPGADNWLKTRMMTFYSNMLTNWLAAGRTEYDFLKAFVKDQPAMDGGAGEVEEEEKEIGADYWITDEKDL